MATINDLTSQFVQNFSIVEGVDLAKPLALFVLGLAIYAWFVFKFYRFLARREIFKFKFGKGDGSVKGFRGFLHGAGYLVKYLVIFPVFLLFWVLVLSVILAFLARGDNIEGVLLIAVALVGVIRVMAYYDEDLSKDLSKMMPFALLGVFLVDISFFSLSESLVSIGQLTGLWELFIYYLIILVLIEFSLRILYFIFKGYKKKNE